MSSKSRLRVAVLCDGSHIRGLGYELVGELRADGRIDFPLVIRTVPPPGPGGLRGGAAWRWARRIDRLAARPFRRRNVAYMGHDVDAEHPVTGLLPEADEIEIHPLGAEAGPEADRGEMAALRAYDLDLILGLGDGPPPGGVASAAKHGLWYLRFASGPAGASQPPGFWEWYDGAGETVAALEALGGASEQAVVIAEASYQTFFPSWTENLRRVRDASRQLVLDSLRHLVERGAPPNAPGGPRADGAREARAAPGPGACTAAALKSLWRTAAFFAARFATRPQWRLLVHEGAPGTAPIASFRELTPPPERFWADPFVMTQDGRHFIFFEDYLFAEQRGLISVIEYGNGGVRDYREIIDTPYHLSFPFVFRHEEAIYMIPESHKNRSIEVWTCKAFPHAWERTHVLMDDLHAVDTVLFEDGGRWWIFQCLCRNRQPNVSEIHVFHSDHPLSTDWRAHPLNPVVRTARVGRMGGRVFRDPDGRIIRCAQDNRFRYGNSIVFCEVTRLTPEAYEERIVDEIRPEWGKRVLGAHHFDSDGQLTVIDANFRGSRFRL